MISRLVGHQGRLNGARILHNTDHAITFSDDQMAVIWDLNSGQTVSVLRGHEAWVNDAVIFSGGGAVGWDNLGDDAAEESRGLPLYAVTAAGDQVALCWNGITGQRLAVLEGHLDELTSVAVVGRGRFTVTSSLDGTARIWDLAASQ